MKQLTTHNPDLEARKQLYVSYRWQQFRKKYLRANKKCVQCGAWSTVVDHVDGHDEDWEAKFWVGPFQPLCQWCHNKKTGLETQAKRKPFVPLGRQPWRKKT